MASHSPSIVDHPVPTQGASRPKLLTQKQMLSELGLGFAALRKLRKMGIAPPEIRLSQRTIRYSQEALQAWVAGLESPVPLVQSATRRGKTNADSNVQLSQQQSDKAPGGWPGETQTEPLHVEPVASANGDSEALAVPVPPLRFTLPDVGAGDAERGPFTDDDFLITLERFFCIAGLNANSYQQIKRSGEGPQEFVRVSSEVLVSVRDVRAWLESRTASINAARTRQMVKQRLSQHAMESKLQPGRDGRSMQAPVLIAPRRSGKVSR